MSVQRRHQDEELDIPSPLGLARPPSAPPPYSYSTTPPNEPAGVQTESHQLPPPLHFSAIPSKSPRRPLPPLPEPRIDPNNLDADVPLASGSRSSRRVSASSSSSLKMLKP